ncbi:zinc finger, CCHC-type [Artemisia annua]|uniref:Zinc finger, CCHC-type n=1 Tax=Artemisia annua TaxID=35608 RepID=A0A2U1N5W6_ARTAN|nr:zinc finger, CCHC-type [Artemisia annua]
MTNFAHRSDFWRYLHVLAWSTYFDLISLRVTFYAINARCLHLAPLVYTLVKPLPETIQYSGVSLRNKKSLDLTSLTGIASFALSCQLKIRKKYVEHPIPAAPVATPRHPVPPEAMAAHTAWPETIQYSGVSLRNKKSLDLTSLTGIASFALSCQLKIRKKYVEHPIPAAPVATPRHPVPPEAMAAHTAWVKGSKDIAEFMLITMDLEIRRNLTHLGAYDMLQELKSMFAQLAKQELLQTAREFHSCKQEEGQSVSSYVLKMKSYIDNLERLGHPVTLNLGTLPKKDVAPALHAIRTGKFQKNQGKKPFKAVKGNQGNEKYKLAYAPEHKPSYASKPKKTPPPKKDNPAKDATCHQCGETGHWRRNYPCISPSC